MKNRATISADIISSTSLEVEHRLFLEKQLTFFLSVLRKTFKNDGFYGRIIKGDYIECALKRTKNALRIALLLKAYIKSMDIKDGKNKSYLKNFKTYGVRAAIGVGELTVFDPKKGILDGEAIYFSGRAISGLSSYGKERVVIKNSLFFKSNRKDWDDCLGPFCSLLDVLFSKMTRLQSEIIYYKLLGKTEEEIKNILKKSQSTINQHSTTAGWNAIESVIKYFEQTIV
ncbi:MAG: RNA polymerase subunit sigma-70 [Bacteroidales bacterium]|jgi:hypothetical protein|nr:RNA polymerase subunit sigma-70 [Bacteroidales bacterium]